MQPPQPKVDGLLLVDKKTGITSHDVVEKFRRRSRIKKVGHTGTLDPLATGLLVLCVGKATRLQAYLMGMEKVYEGVIQFGWATDSYDAAGVPVGEMNEVSVEHLDFGPLLAPFIGAIEQMPPQFSAKKVGGVRAYELARKGEVAALTPKAVTVYEFEIVSVTGSTARFRVRSSAGTYVRSLAHELGDAAGIPAHLKELRRTAIGNFRIADALSYEALENAPCRGVAAGAALSIALGCRAAAAQAAHRLVATGEADARPADHHDAAASLFASAICWPSAIRRTSSS